MNQAGKTVFKQWHYFVLLGSITLLAYWPLTFGVFSLKNDAYIYFLPWRFHISESIQNGYYPFWSPYLYTGLPLYSDMQSGAWNPLVVLISVLTRYNMQILQWELLVYLYIAAIGMYKFIKAINYTDSTAFIGAVSYLCCGFITDSGSFIPWITCAAYMPFLFLYFYKILKNPDFSIAAKLSIVLFLLLTAGYPSYIIYAGYLLLITFICWLIKTRKDYAVILKTIKYLFISVILFSVLSLPVIISFADFLPYYSRGKGASLEQSLTDPFNLFCSISYLFPSAVAKHHEWFHTDVAMRNAYTGIFTLGFFIYSLFLPYTGLKKIIAGFTLFSFIFSLGDSTPLREWCYKILPLMNSFRHPAIIRLFTSIGIILMACQSIDLIFKENTSSDKKNIRKIFMLLLLVISSFIFYYVFHKNFSWKFFTWDGNAKTYIDNLNLPSIVFIQGVIQLFFISLFLYFLGKKKVLVFLLTSNSIFFAVTSLPFSFISQSKTKAIDNYISSFPIGFPLPDLTTSVIPVNDSSFGVDFPDYDKFYNKKITIQNDIVTPTVNTAYYSFLSNKKLLDSLHNMPFAFISADGNAVDSASHLTIKNFSPLQFVFLATSKNAGYLNLLQQFHRNWEVKINKTTVMPESAFIAFMKVRIPAGNSEISFEFKPGLITIVLMYISLGLLFTLLLYLVIKDFRKGRLFVNRSQPY